MDKIAFFVAAFVITVHAAVSEWRNRPDKQEETTQESTSPSPDETPTETVTTDTNTGSGGSENAVPVATDESKEEKPEIAKKIQWLTLEEAEAKMQENPKKLYVDVYTDWCGWCKVQDRKTFTHPEIIRLMNTHFYAVKFDAEGRDSVSFDGKGYGYMRTMGRNGLNEWAHRYARNNGSLGYPTSIFFNEKLQRMQVLATYLNAEQMEMILTYFGKDYPEKGVSWEQFTATFQGKISGDG